MSDWYPLLENFIGGECSPQYIGAASDPLYQRSVLEALNAIVFLQGTLSKRQGTEYIFGLDSAKNARIWPFLDPDNNEIVVIFEEEICRVLTTIIEPVYRQGVSTRADEVIEQIVNNPNFSFGQQFWSVSGNFTIDNGDIYPRISSWTYSSKIKGARCQMSVRVSGLHSGVPGLNTLEQTLQTTFTMNKLVISINADSSYGTSDALIQPGARPTELYVTVRTSGGGALIAEHTFVPNLQPTDQSIEFVLATPVAPGLLDIRIQQVVYVQDPPAGQDPQYTGNTEWYTDINQFQIFASFTDTPPPVPSLVTPYQEADLDRLHFLQSPFGDQELLVFHPSYPIHALKRMGVDWTFEPYSITGAPPDWADLSYPSMATAFQGRLIVTGAPASPETIWCSQSGVWNNFDQSGDITATSAFNFTATDRGSNTGIIAHKSLMFGNSKFEYSVESNQKILQATDVAVEQHTGYGSFPIPQLTRVGNSILLHTSGNRKLRLQRFDDQYKGYRSQDITFRVNHLGERIYKRMFYTRTPHLIIWCVMFDGSLTTCTIDDDTGVVAWTQHDIGGTIIDGCSIVDPIGRDAAVFLVKRTINQVEDVYVERIDNLNSPKEWVFMDSHVRVFNDGIQLQVGGFDHLISQEVYVYADGNYIGPQVVDPNGNIVVPSGTLIIDAGLPFNMRVTTLPALPPDQRYSISSKKRYSKLGLRGVISAPPIIQGQRPPERSPGTLMNKSEPPESAIDDYVIDADSTTAGLITIEEPLPINLTIGAIFAKISSNQL